MRHVSAKNYYLWTLGVCIAFLGGCKEPSMEVASLGKKLPSPVLTNSSPFDQDIDTTGYVQFQGTCDTRLTDLTLSFDLNNWQSPPSQPDLSETPVTGTTFTNDSNCSDGTYNFYLSAKDILQIWNLDVGPNGNDDVDYIYVRGWSLIGYSELLVLKNTRSDENSGAEKIVLEKNWPRGFAGSGQCEYFDVQLRTSNGERATHDAAITFTLDKKVNSTVTHGIAAYTSWDDCHNDNNVQTSFTIPANENSATIIYRFPNSPVDTNFEFKIGSATALSYSNEYTAVLLRDSTSATQRWVNLHDGSHQIYKSQCIPFKLQRQTYAKTPDESMHSDSIELSSSTSALKFYSDSACTNVTSSLSFPSYNSLAEGYVKYTPNGSEGSFAEVSIQGTSTATNSLSYDIPVMKLRVDLSAKANFTRIGTRTTNSMTNGQCYAVTLSPENENGTLITASEDISINLATALAGTGTFHAGSSCMTSISTAMISTGAISTTVYFKPMVNSAGKHYLRFSSGAITTDSHDIYINLGPTKFKLFVGMLVPDSCVEVNIKLTDHLGNFYAAPFNYGTSITVSGIDLSTLHSDPMCTVQTGISQAIPSGSDKAIFYIKSWDLLGTPFSLNVNPSQGLEGDSFSGSF